MCTSYNLTKFRISHSLFWGFTFEIEKIKLQDYTSDEDLEQYICQYGKNKLIEFLGIHHLLELRDKAHQSKFHIHNVSRNAILHGNEIIYVCGHC